MPSSIKPVTLFKCSLVINGPISAVGSTEGPIFKASIFGLSFSTRASATLSVTGTATEIAMHLSPADPNAAPINALVAISKSASGIITM